MGRDGKRAGDYQIQFTILNISADNLKAYFNVMLKEMGVRGVRIHEVYSMDPADLATLPQPVHALIFLFRYRSQDEADTATGSRQDHIWFANQTMDSGCASVAMLNVVNNIPGLKMGKELRDFKTFTQDMTPMRRGDAIDNFDFVRRIHNSFATDNDILNANMHQKAKVNKFKKKQAAAKGAETKRVKKAAQESNEETIEVAKKPAKGTKKKSATASASASAASTPKSRRSSRSTKVDTDDEFDPKAGKSKPKVNGVKNQDEDEPRRSGRARKPTKEAEAAKKAQAAEEDDEEEDSAFHFIAYIPIGNHVWKLDGINKHPQDLGCFGEGGNWINVASPTIMQRMEDMAGRDILFNLMAVTHDPAVGETNQLVRNVKTLQAVDMKLDALFEDWREMEGAETVKDVVTGMSTEFGISQADIEAADLPADKEGEIAEKDDVLELIKYRQRVIADQRWLRISLRDARLQARDDEETARHGRHEYGNLVREWLGGLAAQPQRLSNMIKKV